MANFGVDENRVEIWDSCKPMREFLCSEDMADACILIMEKRDFKDTYNSTESSNISCTPNEVPHQEIRNTHINIEIDIDNICIKELVEIIKEIIGFKSKLYFNTNKPDGTMKKLTYVSKLHALGWKYIELS